jgi:hypothetical protein
MPLKVGEKVMLSDCYVSDPAEKYYPWVSPYKDCVGVVTGYNDRGINKVFWFTDGGDFDEPRYVYGDECLTSVGRFDGDIEHIIKSFIRSNSGVQ